jgi:hypothetical protein
LRLPTLVYPLPCQSLVRGITKEERGSCTSSHGLGHDWEAVGRKDVTCAQVEVRNIFAKEIWGSPKH